MYTMSVLALLALLVGYVHSFSWDIVEGGDKHIQFYYNGNLTHTEHIPSATMITSVTYDPVQNRIFFVDYHKPNMSISSFDLLTRNIQPLVTRESGPYTKITYDPVTQVLFWKDEHSIYSFSINQATSNTADGGNLFVTLDLVCRDIAVDSCGGYIYWITNSVIERARLDGTEREVLIDGIVLLRNSLVIDQQTQKIYWSEKIRVSENVSQLSIESANLYRKDRATLYKLTNETFAKSLTVSKDYIYWKNDQKEIWQLQKNPSKVVERKLYSMGSPNCGSCEFISANYTPECTVPICHNYCLQGDCSVNTDGQPKCGCYAGYSGERCEVNVCYKHCLNGGICSLNEEDEPVCKCTPAYEGARCDVSVLKDFCFQAVCSVSADGKPKVTVTLKKPRSRRNSTAVKKMELAHD